MIGLLFGNILYYLALGALFGGAVLYFLSFFARILPVVATYALLIQIGGVLLSFTGASYVSNIHGYERRVAEDKAEIERLNTEARAKEAELNGRLAKAATQLKKAKDDIKTKQASINARIDSGELRLPTSCGVQANSGATSGDGAARAESERQAIKDIVQIAADGDSAIVSYNSCIARYNQVMETVNEGVK